MCMYIVKMGTHSNARSLHRFKRGRLIQKIMTSPPKKPNCNSWNDENSNIRWGGGGAWYIHVHQLLQLLFSILLCKFPSFALFFLILPELVGGLGGGGLWATQFFPFFYTCMWFKKIYVVPKGPLSNHATSLKFDTFQKDIQLISMLI